MARINNPSVNGMVVQTFKEGRPDQVINHLVVKYPSDRAGVYFNGTPFVGWVSVEAFVNYLIVILTASHEFVIRTFTFDGYESKDVYPLYSSIDNPSF